MPRRREVPKREILPDPKFGDVDLAKFMNVIMQGGKKAVAERIIMALWSKSRKRTPAKTRSRLSIWPLAISSRWLK